jgi:hypothetical protein
VDAAAARRTGGAAERPRRPRPPRLTVDTAYLVALSEVRAALCQEFIKLAKPQTDLEFGTQVNCRLSILACDRGVDVAEGTGWCLATLRLGKLLAERNLTWAGPLPEAERRIADAQQRCDDAQARLDAALLDDAERAARDKESAERTAAFNALTKAERKAAHNKKCGYAVDSRGVAIIGGKA